jgi:hypothetical protein
MGDDARKEGEGMRIPVLAALVAAAVLAAALAGPAAAQNVGIHVEVAGNASGTLASGVTESDGIVPVTPGPADTAITFTVWLDAPFNLTSHTSNVAIDTGEISFQSSAEHTGLGFLPGYDGNPGAGSAALVLSDFGSAAATRLYSITYALGAIASDAAPDWTLAVTGVNVGFPGENIVDEDADEARVRIDAPAAGAPALSPAGAAVFILLLLLGASRVLHIK